MSGGNARIAGAAEFLASFDESRFPEDFLEAYDILECLSQSEYGETFLVADRESGDYAVAKCYPRGVVAHIQEHELLQKLHHADLPAYIGTYENEQMLCVLREYVAGISLSEAMRDRPFSAQQVIQLGVALLGILQYLHTQDPPIIHRDIKPENIILRKNGSVALIDFGISRAYRADADTDTVNLGTKRFSAPEQYGYAQTDSRSDLFSLGMVMGCLLTGCLKTDTYRDIGDKRLAHVIRTCTAFDPSNRYQSAADCRRALCALLPTVRKRRGIAVCLSGLAVMAAIAFAAVSLIKGAPSTTPAAIWDQAAQPASPLGFTQPLMEQAVRAVLGKAETDAVSSDELLRVEGLYICADGVYDSSDGFYTAVNEWYASGTRIKGSIVSLSDVKLLPNLRTLCVAAQHISDIAPLSQLPLLENVEFKHNLIRDVSTLAALPRLTSIGLNDNPIVDMRPIGRCKNLRFLDLCDVAGYDPSFLNELGGFEFLDISNPTDSYLYLGSRRIRQLKLGHCEIDSLSCLSGVTGLTSLEVKHSKLTSLSGIEAHQGLTYLNIAGCAIEDLSPLASLLNLKTLVVSPEQRAHAQALGIGGLVIEIE